MSTLPCPGHPAGRHLAVLCIALTLPVSATALAAPLDLDAVWDLARQGDLAVALDSLLPLEAQGAMDPRYNSLLAAVAMRARDYAQASLALERLVLQQPENAGAWLDLAIASVELGDLGTARRALDRLERFVEPPPLIRKVIAALRWRILLYEPLRRSSWRLDVRAGRDSNANGGLSRDLIPLTLGADAVDLPVDPDSRAHSDNLLKLDLDWMGSYPAGGGKWDWHVGLVSKRYVELHDYDTEELRLGLARVEPWQAGALTVGADWRYFGLGGARLLTGSTLRAAYDFTPAGTACQVQFGLSVEWRRYARYERYDSDLNWLETGGRCPFAGGELAGQLRLGVDRAAGGRPGGDSRRAEITLAWQRSLGEKSMLRIETDYAGVVDADGYSPLLEDNTARRTRWLSLRAEYSWPLAGRWRGMVSAEVARQRSNLPIFDMDQEILLAGVRYSR